MLQGNAPIEEFGFLAEERRVLGGLPGDACSTFEVFGLEQFVEDRFGDRRTARFRDELEIGKRTLKAGLYLA